MRKTEFLAHEKECGDRQRAIKFFADDLIEFMDNTKKNLLQKVKDFDESESKRRQ